MIYKGDFKFTKEKIDHRDRVRRVYSTSEGRQELLNLIVDSGVLSDIGADRLPLRNYAIKKLEEIGLLDEVIIRQMIDHFFDIDPHSIELKQMEEQNGEH